MFEMVPVEVHQTQLDFWHFPLSPWMKENLNRCIWKFSVYQMFLNLTDNFRAVMCRKLWKLCSETLSFPQCSAPSCPLSEPALFARGPSGTLTWSVQSVCPCSRSWGQQRSAGGQESSQSRWLHPRLHSPTPPPQPRSHILNIYAITIQQIYFDLSPPAYNILNNGSDNHKGNI